MWLILNRPRIKEAQRKSCESSGSCPNTNRRAWTGFGYETLVNQFRQYVIREYSSLCLRLTQTGKGLTQ